MNSIRKKYPALFDIGLTSCRGDWWLKGEQLDYSLPGYAQKEEKIENATKSYKIIKKYFEQIKEAKKVLVVAGDSFSNGDELVDHTIPNYPGLPYPNCMGFNSARQTAKDGYPAPKNLKINSKGDKSSLVLLDHLGSNPVHNEFLAIKNQYFSNISESEKREYLYLQREKCWVSKLQEKNPDIFIINLSNSGQSTERSVRLILEFCFEFRTHFPKKAIETVLGLSYMTRVEVSLKYGYLNYCPQDGFLKWNPYNPNHREANKANEEYQKFYTRHYADRNLIDRFASTLIRYFTTADALKIQTTHTVLNDMAVWEYNQYNKNLDFQDILFRKYGFLLNKRFNPIPILSTENKEKIRNKKEYAIFNIFGHFTEYIYEEFAQTMSSLIFNRKAQKDFHNFELDAFKKTTFEKNVITDCRNKEEAKTIL